MFSGFEASLWRELEVLGWVCSEGRLAVGLKVWERKRSREGLAILSTGHAREWAVVWGPGSGAPLTVPAFPGLLRVPGDRRRRDCHPALHLSGLLQPVHPVVLSEQECPFLWLRLVQCVRPGQWALDPCLGSMPCGREVSAPCSCCWRAGWPWESLNWVMSTSSPVKWDHSTCLIQLTRLLRKLENRHTSPCYILGILSSST